MKSIKPERNEPCPCGSGKTFEKCCQEWYEAAESKRSVKEAELTAIQMQGKDARPPLVKLNMGSGLNKIEGFINIDKFDVSQPDLMMDIDVTPWPFGTNEVDEVLFNHSLEHVGGETEVFFRVIKELYRICKPGAKIQINVPHPRHDNFIGDPTHVRVITPQLLELFDKKLNLHWKKVGAANSPLAIYLDVDFEIENVNEVLEHEYQTLLQNKKISEQELTKIINERNNIVSEYQITLVVIK